MKSEKGDQEEIFPEPMASAFQRRHQDQGWTVWTSQKIGLIQKRFDESIFRDMGMHIGIITLQETFQMNKCGLVLGTTRTDGGFNFIITLQACSFALDAFGHVDDRGRNM
jgi:hypothetical protein